VRTEIPQICVRDCSCFWDSPGSNDLGSTPKTSERRGGGSEDNNSPASTLLASAGSLKIAIIRHPAANDCALVEGQALICRRRHQPRRMSTIMPRDRVLKTSNAPRTASSIVSTDSHPWTNAAAATSMALSSPSRQSAFLGQPKQGYPFQKKPVFALESFDRSRGAGGAYEYRRQPPDRALPTLDHRNACRERVRTSAGRANG
jgi:hypothetical protein